ncbi:MAG: Hsp20/alpha crystallin family protein [Bacteroidia bacterium]|nr:Hsp20/alpha crystallin family protein [Bacteroidia bacterium]
MNTLMLYPTIRQLMDSFFSDDVLNFGSNGFVPVNIAEKNDAWVIEVSAPGAKKENFKVDLENNTLRISYQNQNENEEKKEENGLTYHKRQFFATSFERVFNLPENGINTDDIKAEYKDGILYVNIPKNPVQNLVKTISIN